MTSSHCPLLRQVFHYHCWEPNYLMPVNLFAPAGPRMALRSGLGAVVSGRLWGAADGGGVERPGIRDC